MFLEKLFTENQFTIISDISTINTAQCTLKKNENHFSISSTDFFTKEAPVKFQEQGYGYLEKFELSNPELTINVYNGVNEFNYNLKNGFSTNSKIKNLQSNNFENKSIQRAIIQISKFGETIKHFFKTSSYQIGNTQSFLGYFKFKIEGNEFEIYEHEIEKIDYLVIDCKTSIETSFFEKQVEIISYSIGLITGTLSRNEVIILQSDKIDFSRITGYKYNNYEKSLIGIPSIQPDMCLHYFDNTIEFLSPVVFENLIKHSNSDERLFRTIKIIIESSNYPIEIKASTYSVALETIKNIIIENNQEKLNPFKSKKTASKLIKSFNELLEKIPDSEFNSKSSVKKKLEQINQVGNKDSFLLSFKTLNIEISEDDIRCLNMRNDFLHGRLPENSTCDNEDYNLHHIVFKLHFLISSLILKKSGYSGYMLNNIKYFDLRHFKKNINEKLFIKI